MSTETELRSAIREAIEPVRFERSIGDIHRKTRGLHRARRGGAAAFASLVFLLVAAFVLNPVGSTTHANAASRFLTQVAGAARQSQALVPAEGQYLYTGTLDVRLIQGAALDPGSSFTTYQTSRFEGWSGGAGELGHGFSFVPVPTFPSAAMQQEWLARQAAGDGPSGGGYAPEAVEGWGTETGFGVGRDLSTWPTDPNELLTKLGSNPAKAVDVGVDVLLDPTASPELRAAMFTALAEVPSIQLIGSMQDMAGRSAVAISVPYIGSSGTREEVLIDPQTSAILETRSVVANASDISSGEYVGAALSPGTVTFASLRLPPGIVSSIYARPDSAVRSAPLPAVEVTALAKDEVAVLSGGFRIPVASPAPGVSSRLSADEAAQAAWNKSQPGSSPSGVEASFGVANITRNGLDPLPYSWLSYGNEPAWIIRYRDVCVPQPPTSLSDGRTQCGYTWNVMIDDATGLPLVAWGTPPDQPATRWPSRA